MFLGIKVDSFIILKAYPFTSQDQKLRNLVFISFQNKIVDI